MATATSPSPQQREAAFSWNRRSRETSFTPADLTDDQKPDRADGGGICSQGSFPFIKDLENKKAGLMATLVKKGGEVGLMGGGVPEEFGGAGLDKISTTVLTEKLSIYGGLR